jgi:putative transposase
MVTWICSLLWDTPNKNQKEVYSMDEEQKKEVAAFRFGVIHDLVGGAVLSVGDKERLLREKCVRKWSIPHSSKTRVTRSTVQRWMKRYEDSGRRLESLYPKSRGDMGQTRSLDDETGLALMKLRKELPQVTAKILIQEMNARSLTTPGIQLNPSTVYRFLHAHDLMHQKTKPEDRRKFEAEHPNDLWQSDCMHGPKIDHEGKQRKIYLLAFIDDHSRLIPHGEFYLSEALNSFLHALKQAFLTRGLPRKLYTDNGAAFRSKHLENTCASLGVALIRARPYKPQGKGKIERFFRTVRTEFLPCFHGKTLFDINQAFTCWLRDVYHGRIHSSTGMTPFKRFTAQMELLRSAPRDMLRHFRKAVLRTVAKDRTISLNGRVYEAPVDLIGKRVTVLFHEDEPEQVEVKLGAKSYGEIGPVDLHVNARVKRDKNRNLTISDEHSINEAAKPEYQGGKLWGKGERQ